MITVLSYGPDGGEVVHNPDQVSELVGRDRLLWVDLADPTDADFDCIGREFDLHHLAMEDACKHGQRPKLEKYPPMPSWWPTPKRCARSTCSWGPTGW